MCFTGTDFTIRRPYGERGGSKKVPAVHNLHICALNGALGGHLQLWRRRSHMQLISDIGEIEHELSKYIFLWSPNFTMITVALYPVSTELATSTSLERQQGEQAPVYLVFVSFSAGIPAPSPLPRVQLGNLALHVSIMKGRREKTHDSPNRDTTPRPHGVRLYKLPLRQWISHRMTLRPYNHYGLRTIVKWLFTVRQSTFNQLHRFL